MKIFLNKNKSKKSNNTNSTVAVDLVSSNRTFPLDNIENYVSELEVYNNERSACTDIRLVCNVNTIASNVLFNSITEIVKDEGSDKARFYNISGITKSDKKNIIGHKWEYFDNSRTVKGNTEATNGELVGKYFNAYQAVRDTQLSSENFGYQYHCGYDIFNNHTLRSKTFKATCPYTGSSCLGVFNTVEDRLRDADGNQIYFYNDKIGQTAKKGNLISHLYLDDELLSYPKSIEENLIEKNGWFGFKNVEKFPMYSGSNPYDFSKTINNKKACDFIDMYPERDLFSFVPKYNSSRHRIEKNWNYCITYPSSSTTDVCFIREGTNSLKVMLFDDSELNTNGTTAIKIISVSKHGLDKGDYVNVYKGDDIALERCQVTNVVDDYTFYIYSNGQKLSNRWIELSYYGDMAHDEFGFSYTFTDSTRKKIHSYNKINFIEARNPVKNDLQESIYYTLDGKKANIDDDAQDISFKRIVNGSECEYYVRIFSKLPNWKFSDTKPTKYELYKSGSTLIRDNQTVDKEFDNHIGQLGFARNAYNDGICEVLFTDNINIDNLKDNLGRPLSEIYFTIIKNNNGYKEWYGINGTKQNSTASNIEYSHCFGKLTCGFKLSDESIPNKSYINITTMNNFDGGSVDVPESGMTITKTLNDRSNVSKVIAHGDEGYVVNRGYIEDDEIYYNELYETSANTDGSSVTYTKTYDGDVNFYGDLCCYSKYDCAEESIQQVEFRFNTAQRELGMYDETFPYFSNFVWDEIQYDDFDGTSSNNFKIEPFGLNKTSTYNDKDDIINNCKGRASRNIARKEGYCYEPHYKIKIRTFSNDLQSAYPIFYNIRYVTLSDEENKQYVLHFVTNIGFSENQKFNIYDKENKVVYNGFVNKITNMKTALVTIEISEEDYDKELIYIDCSNKSNYRFFIRYDEEIPEYATFIKDGSCRYYWRNIIPNGFDTNDDDEPYPFTNNALYVSKNINLFVKRQDPSDVGGLNSGIYPDYIESHVIDSEDEEDYYNEDDTSC